ncbi:MAG: dienelactone hydrolase family protein [Symploca sp. SIO3E6]|nr:dienelactone hydrolase family protein [Caldora sp. SIO3E6]
MVIQEIKTKSIKIKNGTLGIDAYLAIPEGQGPFPGIVVLQEIFGVNDHIRDLTRRFAQKGYIAIAPALYQRQAPGFETGYTAEDIKIGKQYKEQTQAEELLGDIQVAINYLISQTPVKSNGIGCIGFCFGGHVAYLASTLSDIYATASFYGAGIATWTPGGDEPTISRTKDIKGTTIYCFFGQKDASIPQTEVNQIKAALERHQVLHRIFAYEGAEHGFFCDQRASYNKEAATDAWQQVMRLFKEELELAC